MEDNKQEQTGNSPAPGGGAVDVRPQAEQPSVGTPEAPTGPVNPPPVASAPAGQPKPGLSPELLAQAQAETQKPESKPNSKPAPKPGSHKKGPKLVVMLAVAVFLALAGVAVYAYMQSQKQDDGQDDHMDRMSHQESEAAQPASTKDVEDTAKELDDTIDATNEAQEIPGDGLSEGSVGL